MFASIGSKCVKTYSDVILLDYLSVLYSKLSYLRLCNSERPKFCNTKRLAPYYKAAVFLISVTDYYISIVRDTVNIGLTFTGIRHAVFRKARQFR
jgi:hypothetical protein